MACITVVARKKNYLKKCPLCLLIYFVTYVRRSVCSYLTSDDMLAYVGTHIGVTDLALTEVSNFPLFVEYSITLAQPKTGIFHSVCLYFSN